VTVFESTCRALETALTGSLRRDVLDATARLEPFSRALAVLRKGMQSHVWLHRGATLDLGQAIADLDRRSRDEGLHVLHDWDGKADRVTANSIAVDVLQFVAAQRGAEPTDRTALAILLDYYFMYLLTLLAIRAWDAGVPSESLDRVSALLRGLQGPGGSGQRFADNAETLLLIGTSHFEPNERGYDLLLERSRALPDVNRVAIALSHAQAMGGHLRFGYDVTYAKDLNAMRDDNGADYPWVCFALAELMDAYARLVARGDTSLARDRVVEGLINALSPDPEAMVGPPAASLAKYPEDLARFQEGFGRHRLELAEAFKPYRPLDREYSALALQFNFSQNVLKGTVVDALLRGDAWDLSLNDAFTAVPRDQWRNTSRTALARTLMGYARAHPDTIGGRLSPVIIYDPSAGRRFFADAMRAVLG